MLGENVETIMDQVSVSTMHLANGLEFRAVVVMACDDEVIPSQERIEAVSDDSDLEEDYNITPPALRCLRSRERPSACDER